MVSTKLMLKKSVLRKHLSNHCGCFYFHLCLYVLTKSRLKSIIFMKTECRICLYITIQFTPISVSALYLSLSLTHSFNIHFIFNFFLMFLSFNSFFIFGNCTSFFFHKTMSFSLQLHSTWFVVAKKELRLGWNKKIK